MNPFFAFLPHGMDWIWIVLIVLLLFGPKKLPELARGLGKSLGEFKKAKEEFDHELKASMKEQPQPNPSTTPSVLPASPHSIAAAPSEGVQVPTGTVVTTVPPHGTDVKKVEGLPSTGGI